MRYCQCCNINVEGKLSHCPLCQNELHGDDEPRVYPSQQALKNISFLYKLQMFLVLTSVVVTAAMEFLLGVTYSFHWSLLFIIWGIGGEIWLYRLIKRKKTPSKIIASIGSWIAVLVCLTFVVLGLLIPYVTRVLPWIEIICEVLYFINVFIDKHGNSLAYLITNSILCIATGAGLIVYMKEPDLLWVAAVLSGIIAMIGAVIFMGRTVTAELVRRFHV